MRVSDEASELLKALENDTWSEKISVSHDNMYLFVSLVCFFLIDEASLTLEMEKGNGIIV